MNLQDHPFALATLLQKLGINNRMTLETNVEAVATAGAQCSKDITSLMSTLYCSAPMSFFKNDAVYASAKYKALDKHIQDHLKNIQFQSLR